MNTIHDLIKEELQNIIETDNIETTHRFTKEDLDNCWQHYKSYFVDVLNGDYDLNTAREDLLSLIGSKYDNRING
jgi:hypothetical protein